MSDSFIESANKNILNLLSGGDGLHQDDILYLLGLLGFPDKTQLNHHLTDLKNRNQIVEVENGRWAKVKSDVNGTKTGHFTESLITPSLTEKLPVIRLPGDVKFSSYKNSLQEYCQKKHLSVPQYKIVREGNGFLGTVTFSLNHVKCEKVAGSIKEAGGRAAYEALRELGYLKGHEYQISSNHLKRKDVGLNYAVAMPKQIKSGLAENNSWKSALNEYAQRNEIVLPTYSTVAVTGGFFSIVTFNHNEYKAVSTCKRRKDAEQNAAQVALSVLIGAPLPEGKPTAVDEAYVTKMVSELRQESQTQPVALKNRLQECCQRLGKTLPKYTTIFLERDKRHQSMVIVQDIQYTGLPQANKIIAEQAAAEEALKALELMA